MWRRRKGKDEKQSFKFSRSLFNGLFNLPAGTALTPCCTYFKKTYVVLGSEFILSCRKLNMDKLAKLLFGT